MAISNESKQAVRQKIEALTAQKKIAEKNLVFFQNQVTKLSARVTAINNALSTMENDINV